MQLTRCCCFCPAVTYLHHLQSLQQLMRPHDLSLQLLLLLLLAVVGHYLVHCVLQEVCGVGYP
jgi:hypothetical protein